MTLLAVIKKIKNLSHSSRYLQFSRELERIQSDIQALCKRADLAIAV